ncbi:MAG: hypothetical protein ACRCXA_04440 [Peptostreptococcaceae bacterium]
MADLKNSLKNIQAKESLHATVNTTVRNDLTHNREPHGIYQGIRKDKKIKMNRKTFN